ncbi:MAG: hypothetical protein IKM45_01095 [Opitutales bacterium]|nr:hypothetical protein [Opitutales bacterium]
MKLSYYHYYFKNRKSRSENPPRVCCDLRPILKNFVSISEKDFSKGLEGRDGETIFLSETGKPNVYTLVATRSQELIKAVDMKTLSFVEIEKRLRENETAGFASYFAVSEDVIAIASTLRGPSMSALEKFLNELIQKKLRVKKWVLFLQSVGSLTTSAQAQAMAQIASTSVRVKQGNPLFNRVINLLGREKDKDKIDNICVTLSAKRKRDIGDVYKQLETASEGDGRDKLMVRARTSAEDALADYLIDRDCKFTEDIGTGKESEIISKIYDHFNGNAQLNDRVEEMREKAFYDGNADISSLSRFGNISAWGHLLRDSKL